MKRLTELERELGDLELVHAALQPVAERNAVIHSSQPPAPPGRSRLVEIASTVLLALGDFSNQLSVREKVRTIMEAMEGPWTPAGLKQALEAQPEPPGVKNLGNAVRTAIWQLQQTGQIIRLKDGLYVASNWHGYVAAGPDPGHLVDTRGLAELLASREPARASASPTASQIQRALGAQK